MGTDAARLAGREEEKKVQREAEKMNSCASRAHTSNFHFARGSGSGGSRRAVQSPGLAIPRDTSETRGTIESERAARQARNRDPLAREGQKPMEKGREKQERGPEILARRNRHRVASRGFERRGNTVDRLDLGKPQEIDSGN